MRRTTTALPGLALLCVACVHAEAPVQPPTTPISRPAVPAAAKPPKGLAVCGTSRRVVRADAKQIVRAPGREALLVDGDVYDRRVRPCLVRVPGSRRILQIAMTAAGTLYALDDNKMILEAAEQPLRWKVIDDAGNVRTISAAAASDELYCLDVQGRIWQRTPGRGEDAQGWSVRGRIDIDPGSSGGLTILKRRSARRQLERWIEDRASRQTPSPLP